MIKMNNICFTLKNGNVVEMILDEFVRWVCLSEGVTEVKQKCIELGMSANDDSWVKPLAFQKYIKERFHSVRHDVISEIIIEGA
jgi:hypothetical protein